MQVRKRSGVLEAVNLEKITNSIKKTCEDMQHMDIYKIAIKTISGIYDGIPTKELDLLSIKTAVEFIVEDPNYSKVASRILSNYIQKEVNGQEIYSFSQSIAVGYQNGLISEQTYNFVNENKRKLNSAIKIERNNLFEYYGLRVVYDRYLLKHPINRNVIENPQYFLMRVACGLSSDTKEVIDFYNLISSLEYMPSTPTLFNSGTQHSQMSSCYLLPPPIDDLKDIYKRYQDVAMLSKWAGGIGISMSGIRSSGQLIKGTNGKSNGIIPWIHTLDASVASVNQCLLPDQKIKTPYGFKEIQILNVGDLVYTTNSIDTVDKVISGEYSGTIINIKTKEGILSLTPEHPVLVSNTKNSLEKFEWMKAGDLNMDCLLVKVKQDISHPASDKNDLHDYDHRRSLSSYNEEHLYLYEKDLEFIEISDISTDEYSGLVYDLEMKETKNYQTNVAILHNGGKRKGAAAVYLDTWHPDIMEFLELRDNTGDKEKRAHNLNLANWIPDIFMKRLKKSIDENTDVMWSLIDPSVAPELLEIFGEDFEKRYLELEEQKKYAKQIPVKDLYYKMLKTLSETGNGWICFKDTSNLRCNSAVDGNIVRLSNLCLSPDTAIRVKLNGEITDVTIELLTDLYKQDNDIQILSFNETSQIFEWDDIMNVGLTDVNAEVLTIEYDGNTLECTEDHLILTTRGWIKAGNLLETDTIIQNNIGPVHKLEILKLQEHIDNVKYSTSSF